MFLTADGEAGKAWGNETIRVAPHAEGSYMVTVRLPGPLACLSNTAGRAPTYRLSSPIGWNHRAGEWAEQASQDRAVGYSIRHDPGNDRWYITASWSLPHTETPTLERIRRSGLCLAIDVNSDHLAARVLNVHGNPIGRPIRKNIPTKGAATIAIEQLNFVDAVGRNNPKQRRGKAGRTTRRKTCGIPTSKFAVTVASAAYRRGMWVIAVDPAYTSIWGARWWKAPLDRSRRQSGDRHQAACVVIGRRSQGHSAARKDGMRPNRPADRQGPTPAQRSTRLSGMANTSGNDGNERSPVGAVTSRAEP